MWKKIIIFYYYAWCLSYITASMNGHVCLHFNKCGKKKICFSIDKTNNFKCRAIEIMANRGNGAQLFFSGLLQGCCLVLKKKIENLRYNKIRVPVALGVFGVIHRTKKKLEFFFWKRTIFLLMATLLWYIGLKRLMEWGGELTLLHQFKISSR